MERRVLVTGAGSGLGLATTLHLATAGFAAIGLVPDEQEREALGAAAESRGVAVRTVVADLADPGQRADAVEGLHLYALVNNAGYLNAGMVRDVSIEEARRQLEVMVLAPMDMVRRALPFMLGRAEGRVVNVTSAAVHTSTPLSGWYQASKAALRELTDALRVELRETGVDVVDIEPGGFRTGIWPGARGDLRRRRSGSSNPASYDRGDRAIEKLLPRAPAAEEVAEVIGRVLTSGSPRPHQRVGRDAAALRAASELVPDRVWDRVVARRAGTA